MNCRVAFVTGIIFAALVSFFTVAAGARKPARVPARRPFVAGWRDEMNEPLAWRPVSPPDRLRVEMAAKEPGAVSLTLPRVPDGWPYSYQWGAAEREAAVDLARFPVLVARVTRVSENGYAHLEVGTGAAAEKPVRSETQTAPGLIVTDVARALSGGAAFAGRQRLALRLIAGGANAGASCDYAYVRFVSREDAARLRENPDRQEVVTAAAAPSPRNKQKENE